MAETASIFAQFLGMEVSSELSSRKNAKNCFWALKSPPRHPWCIVLGARAFPVAHSWGQDGHDFKGWQLWLSTYRSLGIWWHMPIRYEFGWYVHNFFLELQEVINSVLVEKDAMWQRYLIRDATIDFCGAVRWRRILWDCELLQQFLFHSQRKHLFLNYLRGCRRLPISNLWKSGVKMQGLSPAPVIFLVLWNIKCDMFF